MLSCPLPPAPGSDLLSPLAAANCLSFKQMRYPWERDEDAIAPSDIKAPVVRRRINRHLDPASEICILRFFEVISSPLGG